MLGSWWGGAAEESEEDQQTGGDDDVPGNDQFETYRGGALAELSHRLNAVVERLRGVPLGEELGYIAVRLREEAEAEKELAEAEELRLKLDALRAADYRDQLRDACAKENGAAVMSTNCNGGQPGSIEHFRLDDGVPSVEEDNNQLDAMYDFSKFGAKIPNGAPSADTASSAQDGYASEADPSSSSSPGSRRLRLVEQRLKEREVTFLADLKARDQKLAAASRALQRTRAHNQQLTAQIGLKDLQATRHDGQVTQLRNLLVEKERRLQAALDEAATSASAAELARRQQQQATAAATAATAAAAAAQRQLEEAEALRAESIAVGPVPPVTEVALDSEERQMASTPDGAGDPSAEEREKPQEPQPLPPQQCPEAEVPALPSLSPDAPPLLPAPDEVVDQEPGADETEAAESAQLAHLAGVTEELAEALAQAREELSATSELLSAEQALRALREQDLHAAQELLEARGAELATLRKAAAQLRQMEEESARRQLEDQLRRALAAKGRLKNKGYHPHLEV